MRVNVNKSALAASLTVLITRGCEDFRVEANGRTGGHAITCDEESATALVNTFEGYPGAVEIDPAHCRKQAGGPGVLLCDCSRDRCARRREQ